MPGNILQKEAGTAAVLAPNPSRAKRAMFLLVFFQLLLLLAAFANYLIHNPIHPANAVKQTVILVCFSASIVVNIFMTGRIGRVYEKEALLATRAAMTESLASLSASMKNQNRDFTGHIHEMSRMVEEDRLEDLSGYIETISRRTTALNEVLKVDNPIIGALLKAKATEADVRRIRLNVEITASLQGLGAMAPDIARIMGNLIDNAFDAVLSSEHYKKLVSVGIHHVGPLLQLEVSGHGPPIDPEGMERVFERAYTTKDGHSGLGLHIVKTLTEKLHGNVMVKTDKEKGNCFIVSLPKA